MSKKTETKTVPARPEWADRGVALEEGEKVTFAKPGDWLEGILGRPRMVAKQEIVAGELQTKRAILWSFADARAVIDGKPVEARALSCFSGLKGAISRHLAGVGVGARVLVEYTGDLDTGKVQPMKRYRVVVHPDDAGRVGLPNRVSQDPLLLPEAAVTVSQDDDSDEIPF